MPPRNLAIRSHVILPYLAINQLCTDRCGDRLSTSSIRNIEQFNGELQNSGSNAIFNLLVPKVYPLPRTLNITLGRQCGKLLARCPYLPYIKNLFPFTNLYLQFKSNTEIGFISKIWVHTRLVLQLNLMDSAGAKYSMSTVKSPIWT
jgi:hypothetical protein